MSSITVAQWRRKLKHPRYFVTSGREALGTIFESRGLFTAIDDKGCLVIASTSLRSAVDALVTTATSS